MSDLIPSAFHSPSAESSIKLVKGDFEYDFVKDSRGDYELRATDLRSTTDDEYLADGDHPVDSGASQETAIDSITTFAAAPPIEIAVNLAYTKAALAQFPSATALKNALVIGLTHLRSVECTGMDPKAAGT